MRVLALVDGDHYPSVTRWGLQAAREAGLEVMAALVVGGLEKLDAAKRLDLGGVPVRWGDRDRRGAFGEAIAELGPEAILDLSDEPVLSYRDRMELVAAALVRGLAYVGPDFRFEPPITEEPLPAPTVAVIGSGKRVAKTALGGHVARLVVAKGLRPVLVAMGRGGPADPVVAGPADVTLEALLARVDRGEHAASDYLEDALTSGVTTVGARRCGGGLAGRPYVTNVAQAGERAVHLGADLVVLEGSGAAVPTVPWDAGVLVAPAGLDPEYLGGYLGPYRILLSDLAVFIIDSGPNSGPENLPALESQVRRIRADIKVAWAELEPVPMADVEGKDAFFATTASPQVVPRLVERLEQTAGCRVVKVSPHLADRAKLEEDVAGSPPFDVLLTELKAAAVDVAARRALDRGAGVVFVDNRPRPAGGDGDLDEMLNEVIEVARERGTLRTEGRMP